MKKTIKLALVTFIISTLFTIASITASAASSGTCGGNLSWTLDENGTLTISGKGGMASYVGNSMYASDRAPWHSSRSKITTVKIEEGVTSIGRYAFYECENITIITIPSSITKIGNCAFWNCTSLEKLNWNAKNVTDFSSENYVFVDAGKNGSGINVTFGDEVETIPAYIFCPSLGSSSPKILNVSGGKSLISINTYAFYGCDSIISITIPDNVTNIDNSAFANCTSLSSITIPDTVTNIGNSTFASCTSLESVIIPDSVANIGKYAFYNCTELSSIIIPNSVKSIGVEAFKCCTSLKKISLPFIGSSREANGTSDALFGYIFGNDTGIETTQYYSATSSIVYKIPSTLKNVIISDASIIPYGAFYGCNSLDSITVNNGVTTIYSNAFYNCSNLMNITIMPQSLKTPNSNIFTGCDMLTIHGIEDSDIEKYAAKYGLNFEAIDEGAVGTTTLTASAEVIEGKIVVTAKANGITSNKYMPVAVYDKDDVMLDLIIIPTNENFEVIKVVFKDIKDAAFVKMFMWNSYNDLVPLDTAKEVTIVRNQL